MGKDFLWGYDENQVRAALKLQKLIKEFIIEDTKLLKKHKQENLSYELDEVEYLLSTLQNQVKASEKC
jgi:hypothetical protein